MITTRIDTDNKMRYFESYIWSLKITSNDFYSITHLPGKDQTLQKYDFIFELKETLKLTDFRASPPVGFMQQGSNMNKDPVKPDKKEM